MTGKAASRPLGPSHTTSGEFAEMMQWAALAALLEPGGTVWVQAPVLDNAPMLDNSTGMFDALEPGWGRRAVRLLDLVLRLAGTGQEVFLATRMDAKTPFLDELHLAVTDHGVGSLVHVQRRDWLSTPGILTRHVWLRGSFELRTEGIWPMDDLASLEIAPESLLAAGDAQKRDWEEWSRRGLETRGSHGS